MEMFSTLLALYDATWMIFAISLNRPLKKPFIEQLF